MALTFNGNIYREKCTENRQSDHAVCCSPRQAPHFFFFFFFFHIIFWGQDSNHKISVAIGRQPKNLGPTKDVEKTIGLGLVGGNGGGMEGMRLIE